MQNGDNCFANYREAISDPEWFYYTVCGFCRSVCLPMRKDRITSRKLIVNSGTAALALDGSHVVASKNTTEIKTPFGMKAVVELAIGNLGVLK